MNVMLIFHLKIHTLSQAKPQHNYHLFLGNTIPPWHIQLPSQNNLPVKKSQQFLKFKITY